VKKILIAVLVLVALVTGSALYFMKMKTPVYAGNADVQYVMQNITADSRTSRTIVWQSKGVMPKSYLEYRKVGKSNAVQIECVSTDFKTDEGSVHKHTATINNLQPNTKYEYRIGDDKNRTNWLSFTTEAEKNDKYKVIIFPDSQCADYNVWRGLSAAAWERNKDAVFFINMGDLVDNGEQYSQWRAWLNAISGMISAIPAAPIPGNHEYYTLDWKATPAKLYENLFTLPNNGAAGMQNQNYSYDYGDVHYVVINTQAEELSAFDANIYARQVKWLETDLSKTNKKWKIALLHRSPFDWHASDAPNEIGRYFLPIFDKYGVDLVFLAHIHSYSRTVPVKDFIPANKGTVYITTGRSGDKVWEGSPKKKFDVVFYNPIDQPNYLTLDVSDKELYVRAVKQDGSLIDEVQIEK
jgi:acid phosphatase type 7